MLGLEPNQAQIEPSSGRALMNMAVREIKGMNGRKTGLGRSWRSTGAVTQKKGPAADPEGVCEQREQRQRRQRER